MAAAAAQVVRGSSSGGKRSQSTLEGSSKSRRRLEGYGGDSGVYLPVAPNTYIKQWKTVVSNQPASTSDTLVFDVRAAKNELVRCKLSYFAPILYML